MDHGFNIDDVPVSLRIGSIGAGLGVGCGIGVGFGKPINLAAVPAVGQAVAGMNSGLGHVSGLWGSAGTGVREVIRKLNVKGLDAGLGCGVGIGYGFGAGLFLKPSAAEQLLGQFEGAAGNMARFAQAKLHELGLQLPSGPHHLLTAPSNSRPQHGRWDGSPAANSQLPTQQVWCLSQKDPQQHPSGNVYDGRILDPASLLQPPHSANLGGAADTARWAVSSSATAVPTSHQHLTQQLQPQASSGSDVQSVPPQSELVIEDRPPHIGSSGVRGRETSAEEFRALLRHERQIARLRAQNQALRSAVCRLDRRLQICDSGQNDDEDDSDDRSSSW